MRTARAARALALSGAMAFGLGALMPAPDEAGAASAESGCQVDYDVVSEWGSGFQANVTLTDSRDLDGWELSWQFPVGTTVESAWNVDWEQDGAAFVGSDVGWNAQVPAGHGVEVFGLVGAGSPDDPTHVVLDGVECGGPGDPDPIPTPDPTPTPPDGAVEIMPLGDSITGSPGCWRGNLWELLVGTGHDVDFVGAQSQGCSPTGSDPDHEGHGGFLVTTAVANGDTRRWLEQNTPEVLLLHFGTNDVWSNVAPAEILDAYTQIIADLRSLDPDATVLVAQIIPLEPGPEFGCADCGERAVALNERIPDWAAGLSTERSPVVVVDQWTDFDPAVDTDDGVHPNEAGNVKIAANWFSALDDVLP